METPITDEIRTWLADHDLAIVPVKATRAMKDAVYNCGAVGDYGGRESRGFGVEWKTAIDCWLTGNPGSGLITLIRGPAVSDPDEEMDALAEAVYPEGCTIPSCELDGYWDGDR